MSVSLDNDYDDVLAANWDEYIENILPLGISNLFLFDGEQVKELADLDSPPQSVVEAINTLLGLELAERLAVDLEILVNRKRKAVVNQDRLQTIEQLELQLAAKKQARITTQSKLKLLQKQLNTAHKKRNRAYEKFKKEGGKIAAEREQIEANINNLIENLELQRQNLQSIAEDSLPLIFITPLLSDALTRGKEELKIQQFQHSKHILEARDSKLLAYLSEISLPEDTISKIQFFIDRENQIVRDSLAAQSQNFLNVDENTLQQLINIQQNILPFQQQIARETLS